MVESDNALKLSFLSRLWAAPWWKSSGILLIGFGAGLGVLALCWLFAYPLGLFFMSICIAAALAPLSVRLSQQMPRGRAIIVIYVALFIIIALVLALLIPPLIAQLRDFARRAPEILGRLRQSLNENNISSAQLDALMPEESNVGQNLIALPLSVFSGVFDALVVVFVSMYLLMDTPKLRRFFLSLFSDTQKAHIESVSIEMLQAVGGYVRGVAIDIVLMSIMTTVGLTLIGLPFALGLGIMTGLFEALPVVGAFIASIPIMVVALVQSPTTALITLVFVVILQIVQGNIISPYVMKNQAEVPQFMVPLAILAGGAVGGVLGALISLPFAATMRVFLLRVVAPFIRQQTGAVQNATM